MSPIVSVLIANYNGGRHVRDALVSAVRQSLTELEILFVDDASTDASLSVARQIAASDSRIRIVALDRNSGPGAARNAGLALARGRWLAILDSDDMMHPDRLEMLVEESTRSKAQLCADDLLIFQDHTQPRSVFSASDKLPRWISAAEYVRANLIYSSRPALGYLKPLIDLSFLRKHGLAYRPELRIGEDYDLVLRLLAVGARFRLVGNLGYFYRKHASSTSHRITSGELNQLLTADEDTSGSLDETDHSLMSACAERRRSLLRARAFSDLITALRARSWSQAVRCAIERPDALPLLRMPIMAGIKRLLVAGSGDKAPEPGKWVCTISRQRIVGNTNGSSTYLLSLCRALRDRGWRLSLVQPSPATLGRWPFLHFRSEMEIFDEVFMRGTWRVGRRLFVARDPRIFMAASLGIAERILVRLGLTRGGWAKPAPYAMAEPWSRDDQIFIARHARRSSRVILADYCFLTPAIPYALCPQAKSMVIMHDLFSSRPSQFTAARISDPVASLNEAAEMALLGKADAVVAIQETEARFVTERLPGTRVILAPMAVSAVGEAQPGDNRTLLFVGSNTAANSTGLRWFLDNAWPQLKRTSPDCTLLVAGSVCHAVTNPPDGVRLLGLVPDLGPVYESPGVVISPLTAGSGLKIKLIEALGQGKAVVATTTSVAGVEDIVKSAVSVTDDAIEFADAVAELLKDKDLRRKRGRSALEIARSRFSSQACYRDFLAFADEKADEPTAAEL